MPRTLDHPDARAALGALVWGGLGLTLFSLVPAKRTGYVLPFAPAFALAIGYGVAQAREEPWLRSPLRLVRPLLSLLALACVTLALVWSDLLEPLAKLGAAPPRWGWLALLSAAAVLSVLARPGRPPYAARALGWGTGTVAALLLGLGSGSLDADRSLRSFGTQIRKSLPLGARVALLEDTYDGRFNLVTRTLHYERIELRSLARATAQPEELWLLASGQIWRMVPQDLQRRFEVARIARLHRGRRVYLLLRERTSSR